MAVILPILIYPVSCAVSFPLVGGMTAMRNNTLTATTWNIAALIVAVIIVFCLYNFFIKSLNQIQVKPNIGISFNGKQLPFRDINSVGTINNINKKGSAFVYADTNGIQVKLSNHIPLELAEAIAKEIKAASGIEWK